MKSLIRQILGRDSSGKTTKKVDDISGRLDAILQLSQKSYQLQRELFAQSVLHQPRYRDSRRLNQSEFRVFSQSGQDGMIEEIFRRIGTNNQVFVEFGVAAGGGFENNSTYLLAKGWSGCWIEANAEGCGRIRTQLGFLIEQGILKLLPERVTAENIAQLFERLEVPQEFDLLSIDIDSHDYWVWKALNQYRPRVVVIEYNSFLPGSANWVLPYDPNRDWRGGIEFGASLKALENLGLELGYHLVGCDLSGSDAFLVRKDLIDNGFCEPFTAENHYEPMRYHLIEPWGYRRELTSTFGTVRLTDDQR